MGFRRLCGLTVGCALVLLLTGCSTTPPPPDKTIADPDAAVAKLHSAWLAAPSTTLYAGAPSGNGEEQRSRAFIRRQTQNLAFRHPDHVPTRMLLAAMAYEANDPIDATRHLDYLLRLQPSHPEAVILRSRIDLEGGNPLHAMQLLQPQIRLRPDHAGLREALASTYFMTGEYDAASAALAAAEQLGGRADRIAYNRGLIAEEQGDVDQARRMYQLAQQHAPGWPRPGERLAGLESLPLNATVPAGAPPSPPAIAEEPPAVPAAALFPPR